MKASVVVIGAGLLGITTAWYLAERGLKVSVVDRRKGPGLETSYANGTLLTPSEADPWNAPGTLKRMLRWLGRENSPLLLRPWAIPGMLVWGSKFLRASRPTPHLRSSLANLRLALYSLRALDDLDEKLSLKYGHLQNGTLKIFRDKTAMNHSAELAGALSHEGLESRILNPDEAVRMEPLLDAITKKLVGAIYFPKDGNGDAYRFTCEMHARAQSMDVKFHFDTYVDRISTRGDHIRALHTAQGDINADNYVLAAGSYSPQLTQSIGIRLPIYPVKGYSVTLESGANHTLRVPLVDFEQKIVIAPLGNKIRIAGTAEFNGYDKTLNLKRGANILRQATNILPWVADAAKQAEVEYWTGLRPMTCDGPPIVGASPYKNLYFNTGHGPLGWTLAAGSAKCLADLMAGLTPALDMSAYSFNRFI